MKTHEFAEALICQECGSVVDVPQPPEGLDATTQPRTVTPGMVVAILWLIVLTVWLMVLTCAAIVWAVAS